MEAIKDRPLLALSLVALLSGTGGHQFNELTSNCDCKEHIQQAIKDERQDCRLDQLEKD